MRDHGVVTTELLRVARRSPEHLRPPRGHVVPVKVAHTARKERGEKIVALDPIVESIHQAPDRARAAGPLVQCRRLLGRCGSAHFGSSSIAKALPSGSILATS